MTASRCVRTSTNPRPWPRVVLHLAAFLVIIGTASYAGSTDVPPNQDAIGLPATSKAGDSLKVQLFGRWMVVGHKKLRGAPGIDDPKSWMGAEIVFNDHYFGDPTCRCEGPAASATEMTVADFFDREYRDMLAVAGMTLDSSRDRRGGRMSWRAAPAVEGRARRRLCCHHAV